MTGVQDLAVHISGLVSVSWEKEGSHVAMPRRELSGPLTSKLLRASHV